MKHAIVFALFTILLQSCAGSLEGDVYSRNEAQRSMTFQWATVEATKAVVIEGDRTNKGQLAGGIIGGAAGNTVTDSSTKVLTTAVGAVAGAVVGQMAEEKMTRAQGMEITLKMDNGEHIVIVQEVESINEFTKGDRVKVIAGSGKLRVAK